jgi:hypothetical protein
VNNLFEAAENTLLLRNDQPLKGAQQAINEQKGDRAHRNGLLHSYPVI